MCGRYVLIEVDGIVKRFDIDEYEEHYAPRFNAAPTQVMPVVVRNSPNRLRAMRWGLIPFWAKDPSIGNRMINARAETLAEKPAFRRPLKSQRCLVPANGFYEWRREGSRKQPYFARLRDGGLFGFAGLWDTWRDPNGELVYSYTIITTEANAVMAPIHDRMPAILLPDDEATWLDPTVEASELLLSLLRPYPAEQMLVYPVSTAVNRPTVDDPSLVEPLTSA